jgi:hypothetical protein
MVSLEAHFPPIAYFWIGRKWTSTVRFRTETQIWVGFFYFLAACYHSLDITLGKVR